ncbi:MAG: glutamine-hydrolyzing carbamoyl-phosphate synthase small subunit [Planctomycetes bacterium]|nr:glutamine-hydrolyzing carbamoyl-phosphate synthase small subunit [Planctomycetota bacterium]
MIDSKLIRLELEDGTLLEGRSFGAPCSAAGEVVFNTGMVGYPETLTDPSYAGQILAFTYPLVGNYGVPGHALIEGTDIDAHFESDRIHAKGVIVSEYSEHASHWNSAKTLDAWLKEQGIPGIFGVDTRRLTSHLRTHGTLLGRIVHADEEIAYYDPNTDNQVAGVSHGEEKEYSRGRRRVVVVDCGTKNHILRSLLDRDITVLRVPWDCDFSELSFDGVLLSNGPGDPLHCLNTVEIVRKVMAGNKPIFGICLGNQILALAAGAKTYKLKFGHRSQNQPCQEVGTKRCFITSQNHGYAVDARTLPVGWEPWFINANDGTNEGIRHRSKPFMSVQFHPEAHPGPVDTGFLFDLFLERLS